MELPDVLRPLLIRGGDFSIRTFADATFGSRTPGVRHVTLDRVVTVTLPHVAGYDDIIPTREVRLYSHDTEWRQRNGRAKINSREKRREMQTA